jgi:hypothetical protein
MADYGGRLGVMQPYFFPYLAHFALLANVDHWVVFDVTQYTPKTWMNRNRVLHPTQGWVYVTVPIQGSSQSKLIREVMLHAPDVAVASIKGKLRHYSKRAPHYEDVVRLVERAFSERTDDSLVALNVSCLRTISEYLRINFEYSICSEMGLDFTHVEHPGQWALRVAQQVGAREYVNPLSGAHLFRLEEFEDSGVRLGFVDMPDLSYDPKPYQFIPSLSVLDVLMWNNPGDVRRFIKEQSSVVVAKDVRRAWR